MLNIVFVTALWGSRKDGDRSPELAYDTTSTLRRLRVALAQFRRAPPIPPPTKRQKSKTETTTEGQRRLQRAGGLLPLEPSGSLRSAAFRACIEAAEDHPRSVELKSGLS